MATITFKGGSVETSGSLPAVGSLAPDFALVAPDLSELRLADFGGKKKVLNIFPSLDTSICALSVRRFNAVAAEHPDVVVLNISADLPFAHRRFCTAEGIERARNGSTFRSTFATDYGVLMTTGPLAGLSSRAVLVLDEQDRVVFAQQVPEIAQEPDYDAVLAALGAKAP
jgi:thiol peroxidase